MLEISHFPWKPFDVDVGQRNEDCALENAWDEIGDELRRKLIDSQPKVRILIDYWMFVLLCVSDLK